MEISPEQLQKAMEIGTGRQNTHQQSAKHWLDDKGKYDSNILGALGEILFRDWIMTMRAFNPSAWWIEFPKMVAKRNRLNDCRSCDMCVNGYNVEIKTVPPGINNKHLLVKKAEYKPADYWVAVNLDSETNYHFAGFAVKKDLFENGLSDKFGKAKCYYVPLELLHPLSVWMFLPAKGA